MVLFGYFEFPRVAFFEKGMTGEVIVTHFALLLVILPCYIILWHLLIFDRLYVKLDASMYHLRPVLFGVTAI